MEDFVRSTKSVLSFNHFQKSCFYRRGKILLKSDAVPTIFLRENGEGTSFYLRYIFLNTQVKIMFKNFYESF